MNIVVALDARSIQGLQVETKDGGLGVNYVYSAPVPRGINRLITNLSITTDDVGAGRTLGAFIRPGVGIGIPIGVAMSLDGILITVTSQRSSAFQDIWLPENWVVLAQCFSTITAGKSISMALSYIDVFQ